MSGSLLRSGSLKDFHALGAVGNPVHSAASQLRAAMRRQLGEDVANMFAIPKQNERGDTIDWYAPVDGTVVPWSAATPEEREEAKAALLTARERLEEKSQDLQAESDTERQVFGKLLAQATRIPSDEHVYLVNGQPVMTFWGFTERGASTGQDIIGNLDTGGAAAAAVAAAAAAAATETVVVEEQPVIVKERRRGWPWWWWLLLIPLLLLLLALLLFGLQECGHDVRKLLGLAPDEPPAIETVVEDPAKEPRDEVTETKTVDQERTIDRDTVVDRDRVVDRDAVIDRDVVIDRDGVVDRGTAVNENAVVDGDTATEDATATDGATTEGEKPTEGDVPAEGEENVTPPLIPRPRKRHQRKRLHRQRRRHRRKRRRQQRNR